MDNIGSLAFFGQFHWSSQSLLPSEQLGIGGYDSVRGYEERQFNADTGIVASLEFRSPAFPVFSSKKSSKANDSLLFLGFIDYGYGRNHTPPFPGQKHQFLASIGPGLRYQAANSISVRCDWGIRLHNRAGFPGGTNLFHFGAVASY